MKAALQYGLALAVFVCGCSGPAVDAPNILLISVDTLRPDRLGCYGGPRATSPTLDALAARGVLFENAFATSPWTLPSHASMLSGHYPATLAALSGGKQLYGAAPQLSTLLADHGYATAAVTGGGFVSQAYGADAGFDHFEEGDVDAALRWLSATDGPFLLFFHTYEPHVPYRDRRFVEATNRERFSDIYQGSRDGWWEEHLDLCCRAVAVDDQENEYLRALYDGGIAAADRMVHRLLDTLDSRGLLDDTIVVLTSDHGEEFWEHTGRGAYHGHSLYDELLRIPLIWVDPELDPAARRVDANVNLVDIVPTLLSRLGIEPPPTTDGFDLSALLRRGEWERKRPIYANFTRHGPPRASVRTPVAKLIVTADPRQQRGEGERFPVPTLATHELYLPRDLAERNNVVGEYPELASTLLEMILAHRNATYEEPDELDAATLERLRSLGYVE